MNYSIEEKEKMHKIMQSIAERCRYENWVDLMSRVDLKEFWTEMAMDEYHKLLSSPSPVTGWVSVKERLPIASELGEWDGKRSCLVVAKDAMGNIHTARIYEGIMDGSQYCGWYDVIDDELRGIVKWIDIPL